MAARSPAPRPFRPPFLDELTPQRVRQRSQVRDDPETPSLTSQVRLKPTPEALMQTLRILALLSGAISLGCTGNINGDTGSGSNRGPDGKPMPGGTGNTGSTGGGGGGV